MSIKPSSRTTSSSFRAFSGVEEPNPVRISNIAMLLDGGRWDDAQRLVTSRVRETFASFITEHLARTGFKRQFVISMANVSESYGYKLLSGERRTDDRDTILAILFALRVDLPDLQRALVLAGFAPLDASVSARDEIVLAVHACSLSFWTVEEWCKELNIAT